ncbi:MAG: hypothetical protein WAM60_25585 [Candidatus Promineifilaceae bacterium]
MITHDLARGLNLCHRIAILNRGKIAVQIDREGTTPGEFLELYGDVTRRR